MLKVSAWLIRRIFFVVSASFMAPSDGISTSKPVDPAEGTCPAAVRIESQSDSLVVARPAQLFHGVTAGFARETGRLEGLATAV